MLPVAVAPSPKFHTYEAIVPVEEDALKPTVSGAEPLRALTVMTAFNAVSLGMTKAKGADCRLSVPPLKAAARVKLVVLAVRDTVQSREVALGFWV